MRKIKLSSKTLVHISSGLYRSTANALKELVSNAFDADATMVEIHTNFPSFDALTCRDNGRGMTKDEFERLMEGGIGNSNKRLGESDEPELTKLGRPVIGRIGIGLLAIAQVCYQFKIVSHNRESGSAFEAFVNLKPYRRDEIAAAEIDKSAEYEIGRYTCKSIQYDDASAGVFIATKDLLATYRRRYCEDVMRKGFELVPIRFSRFLADVVSRSSVRELGNYWQMFWELCISCPVRYVDEGPLRGPFIAASSALDAKPQVSSACEAALAIAEDLRRSLSRYNFTVKLDGTPIRNPVLLPHKESSQLESRAFPITFDGQVEGRQLKYRGYVYMQTRMIKPSEMRGVLIRIRNVAIGNYDLTSLDYEKVQGFRRDWLSGEIYVERGMEDALNIDRHGFNEVHPHYLALQRHLHQLLTDEIFPAALRASVTSGRRKADTSRTAGDALLLAAVRNVLETKYSLSRSDKTATSAVPIRIDEGKHRITIHEHSFWPKNKNTRLVAERIVVAFMLARLHAEDPDQVDDLAFRILGKSDYK